jgi:arylsulfatase A-like enzyme
MALVSLTALHGDGQCVQEAPRKLQPTSVLFVIADQWRAEAFGFAGNRDVKTPNINKLAHESAWFTEAVSTVPVCSPTRASLLTGRRALSHGVFMNDVPLSPDAATLPKSFAAAGYDTGFIGKWHVDGHGRSAYIPPERRQGFQYWKALECTHDYNHSFYYADGPEKRLWEGYDAEAQTADAQRFLTDPGRADRSFLLVLSMGPPHEPYQTAPERYRNLYSAERLTLRPNVPTENQAQARRDLAGYYAHCTAVDDCVGRLLQTLKETGLDETTLVVFTSDHGDMLWSHGAEKKQQPFEESCRVPLLMRLPARSSAKQKRLAATIGTEDIMPTVLGLCGIAAPASVEGLDFSRCLLGGPDPSDGAAAVLCPAPFGQWNRARGGREYRAIRTRRYTYARDLNGPWLLFDNQKDPYQLHNLVGSPVAATVQKQMNDRLARKLKARHDEFLPAAEYIRRWGYTVDATGTVPFRN